MRLNERMSMSEKPEGRENEQFGRTPTDEVARMDWSASAESAAAGLQIAIVRNCKTSSLFTCTVAAKCDWAERQTTMTVSICLDPQAIKSC